MDSNNSEISVPSVRRPAADKILLCLSRVLFASCRSLNSTAENEIRAEQTKQRDMATIKVFFNSIVIIH